MNPKDEKLAGSISEASEQYANGLHLNLAAGLIVEILHESLTQENALIALEFAYLEMRKVLIQRYQKTIH